MTGRELAQALGGHRVGGRWMARCPAHDDHRPSLGVGDGTGGRLLVHCFSGCRQDAVLAALKDRNLWPPPKDSGHMARKATRLVVDGLVRDATARTALLREIWRRAPSVTADDLAGRYLAARGFPAPWPASLRSLARARHPSGADVPALIAAACRWPDRAPIAVQLTALSPQGRKAHLRPVRWTQGIVRGAAVRLAPWNEKKAVVVVEGVEDGLAVLQAIPHSVPWAVLGAANARRVILPPGAEAVLALDGDDTGRRAAREAADALAARGHRVKIAALPEGADPADLLTAGARRVA